MKNIMHTIKCPICDCTTKYFTNARYVLNGSVHISAVFYCQRCDCFIKDIDHEFISSYFQNSVYTNVNYEQVTYSRRIGFNKYILSLTQNNTPPNKQWLDFGCAYGHLIDFLKGRGFDTYGIEISDSARKFCSSKGLRIYRDFDSIPDDLKFSVISFIDSLYYASEPKNLIADATRFLQKDGLLVIRIVNRNWLVKFNKYFRHKQECEALIDHVMGYSKKGIGCLLQNGGFEIINMTFIEKGKLRSLRDNVLYFCFMAVYRLSFHFINLMPGLIIIARKRS